MPSTFTSNRLDLELMATGEQDGLWGGITNDNLEIIDLMSGGNFPISLAASDVTVSTANSANAAYPLTGTISTNVAIKLPERGGFYIIRNATSGAFTVTIKTTNVASVGVVVPTGRSTIVWTDGTDVFDGTMASSLGALAFLATVGTSQIDNASVTAGKLASGAAQPYGAYAGNTANATTSYTLVATDVGKMIQMTNAGANIVTFPPNASVPIASFSWVDGVQQGAGQTTLTAGVGVTLRAAGSRLKTAAQYSGWHAVKISADDWIIFGDLVA